MPAASVKYRYRIYTTDDTTVETTFDVQLQAWEAVGGQEVRPLDGRTETRPWHIRVVDYSTAVTNDLADSSGRLRRLGRLAEFQQNLDSSGWATLATGRISDVFLNEDVASYTFVHEDEHYKARQALIFNSTTHDPTCYVYPPGLRSNWLGLKPRQIGGAFVWRRINNLSLVMFDSTASVSLPAMRELEQDLAASTEQRYATSSTAGNFKFLRFNGDGADYEVFALGKDNDSGNAIADLIPLIRLPPEEQVLVPTWVVDPSTALGSSGTVIDEAFLYSPGAPPTPGQPWHIGGQYGQHPYDILQDIYDGDYGGQAIRYDSTAFTTIQGNALFPLIGFQITAPRTMGDFTERTLYAPFGGIGFVSRAGRIMPRSIFMPSTAEVNQDTLTELTGANLRAPHPTWEHTRRELFTVLDLPAFTAVSLTDREVKANGYEVSADFVHVVGRLVTYPDILTAGLQLFTFPPPQVSFATPLEHDRLSIGRITHRIENEAITAPQANWSWRQHIGRELFDRFGDGPAWGQLNCLSSGTSDILPGNFVKVTLGTYPNMGIQGRGNTRIVQVMSVQDTPYGPVLDYLDAGPNSTVLTVPTVTMSSGTNAPKHEVIVTIGTIPADGNFELQIAAGSAAPSSDSSSWEAAIPLSLSATSGAYTIPQRRSGTTYWARTRATKPGRWRSAWNYSTLGSQTEALTPTSSVLTTGYTNVSVNMSWTNSTASTGYPLEVGYSYSTATTSPIVRRATVDIVPAGTNRYAMSGLTGTTGSSGPFQVWNRYIDPFGGASTYTNSTDFNLTTGVATADSWSTASTAIQLVYGVNTTADVY